MENIDAITTAKPFRCSTCRQERPPGIVVRRINLRPDYPLEVESVDTLECLSCHLKAERCARAEMDKIQPDEGEEQYQDYIRRFPSALS